MADSYRMQPVAKATLCLIERALAQPEGLAAEDHDFLLKVFGTSACRDGERPALKRILRTFAVSRSSETRVATYGEYLDPPSVVFEAPDLPGMDFEPFAAPGIQIPPSPTPTALQYANPGGKRPTTVGPVSLRYGENDSWLPYLSDGIGKNCAGRDPMTIPLDVLSASGHPRRRTAELVNAFRKADGDEPMWWTGLVVEYADIRRHVCLPCLDGNDAEVRRCTTINCPLWPYRMGRNPHNPRRGTNPFGSEVAA
jgi:hypothetical protein